MSVKQLFILLLLILSVACGSQETEPSISEADAVAEIAINPTVAIPTDIPTESLTSTPEPTPTDLPAPTATPTDAPAPLPPTPEPVVNLEKPKLIKFYTDT